MTQVSVKVFEVEEGRTVSLPENVERARVERTQYGASGGSSKAVVIGTADKLSKYVIRSKDNPSGDIDFYDGTIVLGVELAANPHADPTLWFAVPQSLYRQGGES